MKIKNISVGVICLDGMTLLPNQEYTLDAFWDKNEVLQGLVANGVLQEIKTATTARNKKKAGSMESEFDKLTKGKIYSEQDLITFAQKYEINVEGATNVDELYAIIRSYIALDK